MKQLTKRRIVSPILAASPIFIYLVFAIIAGLLIGIIADVIMGKTQEELNIIIGSGIPDEICIGLASVGGVIMFSVGTVMYCISLMFRYGCELQQESDETI